MFYNDLYFNCIYIFDGGNIMAIYNGNEDDNSLTGSTNNDSLSGFDGNDELYGGAGADVLNGGTGNDYLYGDIGGDTYVIGLADGLDEINNYDTDTSATSADVVRFDFASSNVTAVFQDGNTNNLVVQYGDGNQLTVDSYFSGIEYRINKFQFSDVVWNIANIAQKHNGTSYSETLYAFDSMINNISGLEGDDNLYGGSDVDYLSGDSGNDRLYGGIGADILIGGIGNDFLSGDDGADTYLLNKGDGKDEINNYDTGNSVDIVKFNDLASTGVTAIFQQAKTQNLVLQYAGGQLTVDYFFNDASYRIDKFQFTDTTWTLATIAQLHNGTSYSETLTAFDGMANTINGLAGKDYLYGGTGVDTLNGGSGYDSLYGGAGADILTGGTGNDFLQGDTGADTYIFSKGDGNDEIYNYDSDSSVDTVKFTDLASTDITAIFEQTGTQNLVLQYTGGQLIVDSFFYVYDSTYRIDKFQFTDVAWTFANIALQHNGTSSSETLTAFDGIVNTLNGLAGDDFLYGGTGVDNLNGGIGNDSLYGGNAADKLNGGVGNDFLQGDSGADTYIVSQLDGKDEINNYDTDSSVDVVKFTDLASFDIAAVSKTSTSGLLIQYGANSSLMVNSYFNVN
jgi:Ca2+-binding RTX toxin-like protein